MLNEDLAREESNKRANIKIAARTVFLYGRKDKNIHF
jgi:hypothetical protein